MKIGFIGCGNMATAIIIGVVSKETFPASEIIASDLNQNALEKIESTLGINTTSDNKKVAAESDVLVLAVKPQYYEEVMLEVRDFIKDETIIITIAPGKTLEYLGEMLGENKKIIRTMPNTPAMVGAGMTALCPNSNVSAQEIEYICDILSSCGNTEVVPENLMDVVVGVSGSSPAYVFMFIEALADAAVYEGMPRAQAYNFAATAVMGSAKFVLESQNHPGELKDMVCSPKGSTIEAVRVLEEKGMRSAVMEAALACIRKASGK